MNRDWHVATPGVNLLNNTALAYQVSREHMTFCPMSFVSFDFQTHTMNRQADFLM
jgi:hypothetical protein